jgi:gas vesicle protein
MNDNRINGISRDAGSAAVGFVLGAVVGAGVALLLAPATGKETRRRIAESGQDLSDAARDALGQAGDTVHGLKQDVVAAVEAGRETFERARESKDRSSQKGTAS